MLKIALTGNYGMGKSLVLEAFGELGVFTMSADDIVADLLEEEMVLKGVREIFGEQAFDAAGRLDKKRVARMIFMDQRLKKALEDLLHPPVFERMEEALKAADAEVAVVEVPLLYEGGYQEKFEKTIAVYADFTTVLKRLGEKGISRDEILMRQCSQMPMQDKIRRADFVIDNNGTVEETKRQVNDVYRELLGSARVN